jgi:tetratricopeptide (TPR) repeat protein
MKCGIAEAVAAHQAGDFDRAELLYRQLIAAESDLSDANHFLGVLQFQRGHLEEAKELIGRAVKIDPKDDNAYHHHGMVLSTLKQHEDALASFEQAVALNPKNPMAHKDCGVALLSLKRHKEAIASFDAAIALDPMFAMAHYCRATALRKLHLLDLALASYDRALALKPDSPAMVWFGRGVALAFLNRHDEAVACYDKAIAARPEFADAYLNKGLVKLSLGDYAEGWRLYEWRWKTVDFAPWVQPFDRQAWRNDADLSGKTLLLYAEQGFGDAIQFVRYLQFFKDRNCRVMLAVQTALAPLMRENGIEVIEYDKILPVKTLPPFDYHCSLLDMPLAFGTTLDTIPASIPYRDKAASRNSHRTKTGGSMQTGSPK